MRTVMVGAQDWVQQYYAFDLVLVHRKRRKKRKEMEENSWQVQRNASIRASLLQTDLQSSKDSFTLTVGKQNVHHFSSMQRINQF
jgi:hypothetical protein